MGNEKKPKDGKQATKPKKKATGGKGSAKASAKPKAGKKPKGHCPHCKHHCPLSNPRCSKGKKEARKQL